jgi:GNAT superfamily N-acetyltransferase
LEALPAIELAAAKLLAGHAPESVLNEVTDRETLREAQSAGRLWVALSKDVPVGFALVEMLADDLPHLDEIDVHPLHARGGVGTALVKTVCEWTASSGYAEITLTTFRDVPWNMPWYARLGFEEISPDELRKELVDVVLDETARGLDRAARVVMRYRTRQGENHG